MRDIYIYRGGWERWLIVVDECCIYANCGIYVHVDVVEFLQVAKCVTSASLSGMENTRVVLYWNH